MPPCTEACSIEGAFRADALAPRMLASDAGRTRLGERVRPVFLPCFLLPGAGDVPYTWAPNPTLMSPRRPLLTAFLAIGFLSGCAPSLSPLYRDYEVKPPPPTAVTPGTTITADSTITTDDVYARLRSALRQAGWEEGEAVAPNVLSTRPRSFGNWGLYEVTVALDAVPMDDRHVRVLFHPLRRYVTGGRSKLPYLSGSLRRAILPDLDASLEAYGFERLGTPKERDDTVAGGT